MGTEGISREGVIRAPVNGVVIKRNVEEGETAVVGTMNNAGTVLMTVADVGTMIVKAGVNEVDIGKVSLVAPLPWVIKLHVINFFVLLLVFPFSRLVHIWSVPLFYFTRRHIIWRRWPMSFLAFLYLARRALIFG